jgi:hypothetical protein
MQEIIDDVVDCEWQEVTATWEDLGGRAGGWDAQLVLSVYDADSKDGVKRELIGRTELSLNELAAGGRHDLVNPAKTSKSGYTNSGVLEISGVRRMGLL